MPKKANDSIEALTETARDLAQQSKKLRDQARDLAQESVRVRTASKKAREATRKKTRKN